MTSKTEKLEMVRENLSEQVEFFERRVNDLVTQKANLLKGINESIETLLQTDIKDPHDFEAVAWALSILTKARDDEAKAEAVANDSEKGGSP